MARYPHKRFVFSLTELFVCIALVALILPPVGIKSYHFFKKWQYRHDVYSLKSQLQMGNDIVLHRLIPMKILFNKQDKGLYCELKFENKELSQKFPTKKTYPHIKEIKCYDLKGVEQDLSNITLSTSIAGDFDEPLKLTFIGNQEQTLSCVLKGYPHVLHITSD